MKPDYFELFKQPRSAWLDTNSLKEVYLRLSSLNHPDHRPLQQNSNPAKPSCSSPDVHVPIDVLNTGFQCLSDLKKRIEHLIEVETGIPPANIQSTPEELANLGIKVMQYVSKADRHINSPANIASPMDQTDRFLRGLSISEEGEVLITTIDAEFAKLESDVQKTTLLEGGSSADQSQRAMWLKELEILFRTSSYLSRWSKVLRERQLKLTLP